MRAGSISHAEYEIMEHIITSVDLHRLKSRMVDDKHSAARFDTAAENVLQLISNMMERRRHRLPKTHPDYEVKS